MKMKHLFFLIVLTLLLSSCSNVENEVEFYPDTFSDLYTCPYLDFANNEFIFNDGTMKLVALGVEVEFNYTHADKNIYYIFDGNNLQNKIVVFDDFYIQAQSDVDDALLLQMEKDMFINKDENKCIRRDY